jgi:Ca2+-binding RTX toxin-like protein
MALNGGNNPLSIQPVYSDLATRSYSGTDGDYMDAGHHAGLALGSGTISLSFSVASLPGDKAIISKDGSGREAGGHFTVWVKDGTLIITQESATGTEYLKVPDFVLTADQTYQLGLSFGDKGLMVWIDGELIAAEPEFKQGLEANDRSLVIGGTRAWRDSDAQSAHTLFEGEIGNVMVFDGQLGGKDMRALANAIDPALDTAANMASAMENLMPVLGDMHHGSDTLKEILNDHGVTDHGHFASMPAMKHGSNNSETVTGTSGRDGINAWSGDDRINALGGDDVAQGGYGNDTLDGGDGNDILDGGHGEDSLMGGAGDDLLISRADGREGEIFYDPDRDEGDPYGELTNGKLYPNQPIPADDVLVGGGGADIFYFQTLINAKERYIEKHTRDDGSINWHGVAGENDKLHDHWVDIMGDDVIKDFDRDDGDRIVIEGHTTQIASITYGDVNGDGVMDHSVIELYSDQGNNGGAHNDDRLGTITVYGDLVKDSDIEHTAAPAYGIVHTIDDLQKALAPQTIGTDTGPITPPANLPTANDLNLGSLPNPVFAMTGTQTFVAEERSPMVFDHSDRLDLVEGTITFNFEIAELDGYQVLFSKDASDYGNGGHVSVYLDSKGNLTVRVQDLDESYYLKAQLGLETGTSYDFAMSFGEHGVEVLLDGARVAYDSDIVYEMTSNTEALIIGASGWSNTAGQTDKIHSHFTGTISNFLVFGTPLSGQELQNLELEGGGTGQLGNTGTATRGMALFGTEGDDSLIGGEGDDTVTAGAGDDRVFGHSGDDQIIAEAGHDSVISGDGDDLIDGGDGNDKLWAGLGDDTVFGGAGSDQIGVFDGDDKVWAGSGDDSVYGRDGDDEIGGGDGNDILFAADGNDSVYGGAGNDTLWLGTGDDLVRGGNGDDVVYGLGGQDTIWTGGGNDTLDAGDGNDIMGAFNGDDEVWAGRGEDTVYAGEGHDQVHGGDDDDQIHGVGGNDSLYGDAGDDDVRGGDGDDRLHGNAGSDRLDGQAGDDSLTGGSEADVFVFSTGQDRVADFDKDLAGEQIDLSRTNSIVDFADLLANHVSQAANGDAVISDGLGNSLVLQGVDANTLLADDFIF